MMTVKDLMSDSKNQMSVDGEHWEPIVFIPYWWRNRVSDAIAVLKGEAGAIRNTRRADLKGETHE